LQPWCRLNPEREGSLPIDDRDGGCDCQPKCPTGNPWTRQIAAIDILEGDAVTDSAEAYYLMKQRGITNVIVMGVHTNMCVLGRPFSIRQLVYQGLNVVLMRDLTDTMYNSRSAPYVSHFTGTDLVVEHIERHWCPTITSTQFIGGKEFRFKDDRRPHLAIIVAEDEYKTEETLPVLALQHLGRDFRVSFVFGSEQDRNDLPGLEVLESADLALFSVRRRVLPQKQLEAIRKFVSAGRGVLGIRTASHAFSLRSGQDVPPGFAAWPTFDPEVLGGNYQGHHGQGPKTAITLAAGASEHEILRGVELSGFEGHGSLYKNAPLVEDALPLLMGSIPDKPPEPIAWTFIRQDGGRSFYTSLGHKDDFEEPAFQKMLYQAACWVVGRKPTSP
jgi:type 1 glutamine amidotransferase